MNAQQNVNYLTLYHLSLLMYHEYIRNRDERFFLEKDEKDYTDDAESVPISKLKTYWEH